MDIKQIKQVFKDNGVTLGADDAWQVQGTWVIKHKALERLAAEAKIKWHEPKTIRAERDECVVLVSASRTDKDVYEWSYGECAISVTGGFGNYKVKPGGNMAAYVYAMAEKRGKDRVILKLVGLHGAYSEEEADDFKDKNLKDFSNTKDEPDAPAETTKVKAEPAPQREVAKQEPEPSHIEDLKGDDPEPSKPKPAPQNDNGPAKLEDEIKTKIKKAKTINAVTDLMLHADTQKALNELPEGIRDELRDFAKARLVELGWPTKKAS